MNRYIRLILLMTFLLWAVTMGGCGVSAPEKLVKKELDLVQKLDEETILNFVSYEDLAHASETNSEPGPEATEAIQLFFKNFRYKIINANVQEQSASVTVEIKNLDTKALAKDVCKAMITQSAALVNDSEGTGSMADSFTLLRDCLLTNQYETKETQAVIPLVKQGKKWLIVNSAHLEDDLVSGFVSHLHDPYNVLPEDVLSIYLDTFRQLSGKEWLDYFGLEDIFATGNELYPNIDAAIADQIAEFYNYKIIDSEISGSTATVKVELTSISLESVMNQLSRKLLEYAKTTESIRASDQELAEKTSTYLLESLQENALSTTTTVEIAMSNDGSSWSLDLDDRFTDALLGDVSNAISILSQDE